MKPWSRKQLKAIELIAQATDMSCDDMAREVGISSRTLRTWKLNPDFINAIISRSRELVREALPEIYKSLSNNAKKGEPQHIKIVLDHLEKLEQMREKANEGSITFTWRMPTTEGEDENV